MRKVMKKLIFSLIIYSLILIKPTIAKENSVGVEGCSHKYKDLAGRTFSWIQFALNYKKIDSKIGLRKVEKKNTSIPVVGIIYTKDGTPVERVGSVIYWYENGKFSNTQNWLPLKINKEEFVADFGKYPKVICKIVGMN